MPINRLFRDGKIKPEDIDRLNRAFTIALHAMGLVDRDDPIAEMIARKIIEINDAGTLEPQQIAELAARQLKPPI